MDSEPENIEDICLDQKTLAVKLNGKDHIVVEANSETATEYRNIWLRGVTMREGGMEGSMAGLAESESYLVSQCVFLVDAKGNRVSYDWPTVKTWPNSAVKRLYNMARAISDLEEKATDKAKK